MDKRTSANASERSLRPGERYEPALGRVLYSAAWLEAGDDDRLAHEVTVFARRLGTEDRPQLVSNRIVVARTRKEAALVAARELIASRGTVGSSSG